MNFNLKLGATFVQNDNFLILNHEDIIHETCYLALSPIGILNGAPLFAVDCRSLG